MRLFQNSAIYPSYASRLHQLTAQATSFAEYATILLDDRWGASHLLLPVLEKQEESFLAHGNDELGQRMWARENGLPGDATLEDILLTQIEHHRTDVFYNLDPVRFGPAFLRRLPQSVKRKIAWRAAPSGNADLGGHDLLLCNFPTILKGYEAAGYRSAWFAPAHDPELERHIDPAKPIDLLFVGSYSRHHRRRAAVIEAACRTPGLKAVELHLDTSRLTRLAETPLGILPSLRQHRRPAIIQRHAAPPVFGRDLYDALGRARIILNGAIDMAGDDRGNMRCFEALGAGALLLSDEGRYPEGMVAGETLVTYRDAEDAVRQIEGILADRDSTAAIAQRGHEMVKNVYAKKRQWASFRNLIG